MTACRSSFFLDDTRSSSPWTCARTPLGPSSRMILETFFAFSWEMPSFRVTAMRYSLPVTLGSAASRCLRETLRLTSFSLKTSRTALARSSLLARISTPCSPDQVMEAPTPRKSNRVLISLAAWFSALSASCRSILLTMSKLDSLGMIHRLDGDGAGRHAGCARMPRRRYGCRMANVATGRVVRYSSLCCPTRRHLAGCPSGQRERSVKPSAKPTQVRTLDLPPVKSAAQWHFGAPASSLRHAARCHRRHLDAGCRGIYVGSCEAAPRLPGRPSGKFLSAPGHIQGMWVRHR